MVPILNDLSDAKRFSDDSHNMSDLICVVKFEEMGEEW
jgi:hypothetical protein